MVGWVLSLTPKLSATDLVGRGKHVAFSCVSTVDPTQVQWIAPIQTKPKVTSQGKKRKGQGSLVIEQGKR